MRLKALFVPRPNQIGCQNNTYKCPKTRLEIQPPHKNVSFQEHLEEETFNIVV